MDIRLMIVAMSMVQHLKEFIDTGEPADIQTVKYLLETPELQKWMDDNSILMPLRRDGRTLLEAFRD